MLAQVGLVEGTMKLVEPGLAVVVAVVVMVSELVTRATLAEEAEELAYLVKARQGLLADI